MLGFKSEAAASISLAGIELVHMMRKLQGNFGSTALLHSNNNSQYLQHNCVQRLATLCPTEIFATDPSRLNEIIYLIKSPIKRAVTLLRIVRQRD